MSPHVLLDEILDALLHPGTPSTWLRKVSEQITEMMRDERITIEEFHHYCGRLNKIVDGRKEVA